MDRKYVLIISALTLLAIALAILLPGGRHVPANPKLPWLITVDEAGALSVFGITLGHTTLAEAEKALDEESKLNLFVSPKDERDIEAYFERIFLSGLKADVVLTLDVDEAQLNAIYERGVRISKLGSGAHKVNLADEDTAALAKARVSLITFIPATDLDEKLLQSRFGEPEQKRAEESGVIHWLYPSKGLDIAVNPNGKEVFQYINPARFNQITDPLAKAAPAQQATGEPLPAPATN